MGKQVKNRVGRVTGNRQFFLLTHFILTASELAKCPDLKKIPNWLL